MKTFLRHSVVAGSGSRKFLTAFSPRRLGAFMARLALWIAWIALLAAPCLAVAADKTAKATAPARNDQTANGKTGGDKAVNAKGQPAEKKGKPRKLSLAEQFLREADAKLDGFTFGPAALAAAGRYAKQAKALAARLPYDLIAARYQREYQNRPDRAADDCQQPIEAGEWLKPHLFGRKFGGYVPWEPFNF